MVEVGQNPHIHHIGQGFHGIVLVAEGSSVRVVVLVEVAVEVEVGYLDCYGDCADFADLSLKNLSLFLLF
ncbi:hypothetical protein L1987_42368 [Smallanthus sonchifolius]|uniref:Uncharacterized protein n=1 Tax=Smallanthus sonchifolius TaxID=185202 RepID=A0ACB9GJA1_9ASTR|nr:hypothetical protein L1987_42368 [Smallanthus sonchifolius]